MTSRLVALSFDASDPARLARFWAAALRWDIGDETSDEVALAPTDGTRFTVVFRRVAEPKVGKNPIHLDLTTTSLDDQRASVAQLLELGGHHVDVGQSPDDPHVVLADPEGNELCLIEPTNRFLSTCGRFGSITCDGSPAVGSFWSKALAWPLVWDQDEETAIRAPDETGPFVTWGPPVPSRSATNRLHLEITPTDVDHRTEIDRLVSLGATRIDEVDLADPDGNRFTVLSSP